MEDHQHVERIDDEIMVLIRKSRFVVADTTGRNPNVLFEAGYALGLDRKVVWTCRDDDQASHPFDVRQYKRIGWRFGGEEALAHALRYAIENVVGGGPLRSETEAPAL
jgi:hypothetical protein